MLRGVLLALTAIGLAYGQSFEVASIRPNQSGDKPDQRAQAGGRFVVTNESLKALIQFAYNVQDFQVTGGASWTSATGYDILAKPEVPLNPSADNIGVFRGMLRELLAERFHLQLRHTMREMPVYVLVRGKEGAKLTAKEKPANPTDMRLSGGRGLMVGQNMILPILTQSLASVLGRPVNDETGLNGYYDFRLEWTPDDADPTGPSLYTAIQEQLGLRLETHKAPVEVLVIEHAEPVPEP